MVRARGAAQHNDLELASKPCQRRARGAVLEDNEARAVREDMQSERERCRERVRGEQRQNCQRDDQMDKDRATRTTQWSARKEDTFPNPGGSRCVAHVVSQALQLTS